MNWSKIEGVNGWVRALHEVLDHLQAALDANDANGRDAALQDLRDYVKYSPDSFAERLDDLALMASMDAVTLTWQKAIVKLKARSVELEALGKSLNVEAAENRKTAASIRMTKVKDVIEKSTGAIKSFLELKRALEEDGAENLPGIFEKIDRAVAAVREVRGAVNNEV